jgi:hypothetical protein
MGKLKDMERISQKCSNNQWLVKSQMLQAATLGMGMNQPRPALPLVNEAYRLAVKCDNSDLISQVEAIRGEIQRRLK